MIGLINYLALRADYFYLSYFFAAGNSEEQFFSHRIRKQLQSRILICELLSDTETSFKTNPIVLLQTFR